MKRLKWTFILLMGVCATIVAQEKNDEALFREAIQQLGSDEFGGRKPLSAHEALTVNYIADQFKALGLTPGNGDSYFQPVPLLSVHTAIKKNVITVNGNSGRNGARRTSSCRRLITSL